MAFGKLKSISPWLISLWTLALFLFSGCGKSPATQREELEREISIGFCEKLLANPQVSKEIKSRAESVLQKRKDDYSDPEPILIYAVFVETEYRPPKHPVYLAVGLSDEDGDIAGIGIRERHLQPNGQTMIIEEMYPIFCYGESQRFACILSVPVVIRKEGERKNEQFWQKYLERGVFDEKLMPNIWISTPQPGKVDVQVWIYDHSGHNSQPVRLESILSSAPDPNE